MMIYIRSFHPMLSVGRSPRRVLALIRRQRGVALITVLMVVALCTSIAAYLIWVVNQRIELHEMHYRRLQSRVVAQTGAEWAASILLIDQRQSGQVDTLNEIWAQPLPTVPVRVRPEDPTSAIEISGSIADEQGKFNINNLAFAAADQRAGTMAALQKLLTALDLPIALGNYLQDWLDADDELSDVNSAESDFYLRQDPPYRAANQPQAELSNLAKVRGVTPAVLTALAPYLTFIPKFTTVNVNTASAEVLSAMVPDLSYPQAVQIVEQRKTKPFENLAAFLAQFPEDVQPRVPVKLLSVGSAFFSIKSQAAQNDNFIQSVALVERRPSGWPIIWWQKIQ